MHGVIGVIVDGWVDVVTCVLLKLDGCVRSCSLRQNAFRTTALYLKTSPEAHLGAGTNFCRLERGAGRPQDRRNKPPTMLMMLAPCDSIISMIGGSFFHEGSPVK